jgi:hypothetical protein
MTRLNIPEDCNLSQYGFENFRLSPRPHWFSLLFRLFLAFDVYFIRLFKITVTISFFLSFFLFLVLYSKRLVMTFVYCLLLTFVLCFLLWNLVADISGNKCFWVCLLLTKQIKDPWFQTFAVFWMLYDLFWVIPRLLNFICRRFGTLSIPSS